MLREVRTFFVPLLIAAGPVLGACGEDDRPAAPPPPMPAPPAVCVTRFRGTVAPFATDAELSARLGGAGAPASDVHFFTGNANDGVVGNDPGDGVKLGIAKRLGTLDGTMLLSSHDRLYAFSL